ncbi:hypothetical protein G3I60_41080 [Streptomyces sp. SID13666]|uniref:hypothetical protein n=1 Tax=unclassified Streptomyces TaxID=2593676 RepID=UPI0013C1F1CE|nr:MULTISPECIES: hypothetical protein [unclassified Streptomyces]NEA60392.1 hypothetical protein [Streptomyces sp. SID13666]NEA76823.1 hypothetical protein [Streptomyces sp. SID13588]
MVAALYDIVQHVDADLGLRLFLRTAKAYCVPVPADQYDRLLQLRDELAYHYSVIHQGLNVQWPPLDPGDRALRSGRFGLAMLGAMFDSHSYYGDATPQQMVDRLLHADNGLVPGIQAAVLLDDVQRLIDSPMPDRVLTDPWRAISGRYHVDDAPDITGRPWLREIAGRCRTRLLDVDPTYAPYPAPVQEGPKAAVLYEIQACRTVLESPRGAVTNGPGPALEQAATTISPDLAFRLFLQILMECEHTVTTEQFARYTRLGQQLGYHDDYVEGHEKLLNGHVN